MKKYALDVSLQYFMIVVINSAVAPKASRITLTGIMEPASTE
jgi:hypothetical protein